MKSFSNKRLAKRGGFSIAELMVVILIIGLLATQVVPKVLDSLGDAKWGKAGSDLSTIGGALKLFAIKNGGDFPDSLQLLVDKDDNGVAYLEQSEIPKDPWDNEYVYMPPDGSRPFELWTYGKDGDPGGDGDDRDLSWQNVIDGKK